MRGVGRALAASTLLLTGAVIGSVSQHLASADISSGPRLVLVPLAEPCRLVDTRPEFKVGPKGTPLGPGEVYTIAARPPAPTGECNTIPDIARALSLNVTAIGATAPTFLTIWPDGPRPLASSLNPFPGEPPAPNAVTAELAGDGTFNIFNRAGSVDVLVDVNGYYGDHDHDDRSGVEFASGDQIVPLGTQPSPIRTIDLDTVVPGYAIVTASGYFKFTGIGEDIARCSITDGAKVVDNSRLIIGTAPADSPSIISPDVYQHFSSTMVFPVVPGTTVFQLTCETIGGAVDVGDTSLVAQFVPNRL